MSIEKDVPETATKNEIKWVNDRIDRVNERLDKLRKTLRLLFAHLVDKKIIVIIQTTLLN